MNGRPELLERSAEFAPGGDHLHRRRTLYLLRHGEAEHNVLEKAAQKRAQEESADLGLSEDETHERMERARKAVLQDPNLHDARLTDNGRRQAHAAAERLGRLCEETGILPPTQAMVSPFARCLETCKIVLDGCRINAHVRPEIGERRTRLPPDEPSPPSSIRRLMENDERFVLGNVDYDTFLTRSVAAREDKIRESKEMLRDRAGRMFDLLMEMGHRHIMVVSHKGYLRELERGLLEMPDSPLFDNCELRVYRVIFTKGERELHHLERLA